MSVLWVGGIGRESKRDLGGEWPEVYVIESTNSTTRVFEQIAEVNRGGEVHVLRRACSCVIDEC